MSAESAPTPAAWPVLNIHERRVLGVLVEKAKTTADAYPLSLNALTTGSNQKSNRDPLLDLNDLDVEEALGTCQKKLLVFKITGGRVDRWKHNLYEAWNVGKVDLAVLGELLLRGPQTEGELRARANRMEPIADLEALRTALKPLAQRGLVVYLTPEGRRGTTLTHGFQAPAEIEALRARHGRESIADDERPAAPPPMAEPFEMVELRCAMANVQARVATLESTVAQLTEQLTRLRQSLGES